MTLAAAGETGTVRPNLGLMVLHFFGGLVALPLVTLLVAMLIGVGGLYDEGFVLGVYAGQAFALAGLGWFSYRRRAGMLLVGGITATALWWYLVNEYGKAPI